MGRTRSWLTTALVVLLLAELIRVAFPSVGWYLRDTVGVATVGLVPYALGPFVASLLAPLLARLLTARGLLVGGGLLLAGLRVAEQLSIAPQADLWLSLSGVTVGLWLVAVLATRPGFGAGVLVGVTADVAVRGVAGTLDLSWLVGPVPAVGVAVAAAALAVLLIVELLRPVAQVAPRGLRAAAHVVLGPLLLAHLLILGNQGWVAQQLGVSSLLALGVVLSAHLLGVVAASAPALPVTGTLGGLLVMLAVGGATTVGPLFAAVLALGVLGSGLLLAHLGPPAASDGPAASSGATSIGRLARLGGVDAPMVARPSAVVGAVGTWLGLSHVLLALTALAYYIAYDLALPVDQNAIRLGLGIMIGVGALLTSPLRRPTGFALAPVAVTALLVLAAAPAAAVRLGTEAELPPPADELRLATYNLHSAYSTAGRQDPEALATTIEQTGATVVGLQEISRGWLLNGSTDLVAWLSQRLDMPYVAFHPTTEDPLWGNAILSRRPLRQVRSGLLPQLDATIRRGWLAADVRVGDQILTVVNTHLHHTGELETIHAAQLTGILEQVDVAARTALVGDLNARPDFPQLDLLRDAGLRDAWEGGGGEGAGHTANSSSPEFRIDWIWLSPDLEASDAEVVASQASDHFPVAVTVEPQ